MLEKIKFMYTDDNSVGLYDNEICDIFHSKSGALNEALEKFVLPSDIFFINNNKKNINVLDICYGIGYNTKALLNTYDDFNFSVDALEFNQELIILSPFIRDNIFNIDIKLKLLSSIILKFKNFDNIYSLISEIENKESGSFFTADIIRFIKLLKSDGYILSSIDNLEAFLHNIYYSYISNSNKRIVKNNNIYNSNIDFKIGDARTSIKLLNNTYDIIFLDAFSPKKDPRLWTIDFLTEVKKKMHNNSILLSYSKSTPFRSALLELGFHVGKTILKQNEIGTIASLNFACIINPLNDIDRKYIQSRSGIVYKDPDLKSSIEKIVFTRELEIKFSDRVSRTSLMKYLK